MHVEGAGAVAHGHEVEHALSVEVSLAELERLDLHARDMIVGFLRAVSAGSFLLKLYRGLGTALGMVSVERNGKLEPGSP